MAFDEKKMRFPCYSWKPRRQLEGVDLSYKYTN